LSYLEPQRLDDGRIMVPKRAESEDGQSVGIGWVELTPDDPQYRDWLAYVEALDGPDWARRVSDQVGR
jgi:hypothetical protein